jgi:hypothetical protein
MSAYPMSIVGPVGLERNNGTRTDPHSAPGTHAGAGAVTPLPSPSSNDGCAAAAT